mmetsp:Transcript_17980/g.53736  ORF Transcript_17980/g.53736 Transcript_17980/m.53736 type:complete len:299 (+) Transcript_17980:1049-1945(+)
MEECGTRTCAPASGCCGVGQLLAIFGACHLARCSAEQGGSASGGSAVDGCIGPGWLDEGDGLLDERLRRTELAAVDAAPWRGSVVWADSGPCFQCVARTGEAWAEGLYAADQVVWGVLHQRGEACTQLMANQCSDSSERGSVEAVVDLIAHTVGPAPLPQQLVHPRRSSAPQPGSDAARSGSAGLAQAAACVQLVVCVARACAGAAGDRFILGEPRAAACIQHVAQDTTPPSGGCARALAASSAGESCRHVEVPGRRLVDTAQGGGAPSESWSFDGPAVVVGVCAGGASEPLGAVDHG